MAKVLTILYQFEELKAFFAQERLPSKDYWSPWLLPQFSSPSICLSHVLFPVTVGKVQTANSHTFGVEVKRFPHTRKTAGGGGEFFFHRL